MRSGKTDLVSFLPIQKICNPSCQFVISYHESAARGFAKPIKKLPMKTKFIVAAMSIAALATSGAQTFVLDSPVLLTSAIRTQGADTTVTKNGVTVVTKRLKKQRFNNVEILTAMLDRSLITGSTGDWSLAYLSNESGVGGIYAKKAGVTPVAVPSDLLTLPVFGPSVTTGHETTGPKGYSFLGTTEIASSTITVDGIPASGIATNGIRTINATIKGTLYQLDTVSTTMTFTGGMKGDDGDSILDGIIVIGKANVSKLTTLP